MQFPRYPIPDVFSPLGRPWHTPKNWRLKTGAALVITGWIAYEISLFGLEIERRFPAPLTRTVLTDASYHAEDDDPTFKRDPDSFWGKFWASRKRYFKEESLFDQILLPPAHINSLHSTISNPDKQNPTE